MRADRLLQILLILQTRGRATAGELAARLEVSVRTIQRDMDALSGAGVPVYAVPGGDGGWRLVEGFRTSLTGLTPSEALAVAVGRPERVLRDLGLDDGADLGMLKVLAALPVLAQEAAHHAQQRVHVDLEPWGGAGRSADDREVLRALYQAASTDSVARIRYGARATTIEVEPLGLVAKGVAWYLVAVARRHGQMRTYRASRISDVVVTDTPFPRPPDFDLERHWRTVSDTLPSAFGSYAVSVRVNVTALRRLRWSAGASLTVGAPDAEGWIPVQADLENADEALATVLALGANAIVDRPSALRATVKRQATAMLEAGS